MEDDPIVGNVSQSTCGPPGQLCFDANFECGNLGRVDVVSNNEYDLFIRPDTCNPKYRRVIFNILNFSKLRTLFDTGNAAPVYRVASQENWCRIPVKNIYYYSSKAHGDRFILSFIHVFPTTEKVYFAYCIPYSYSKLQDFLLSIERKNFSYFKRTPLTNTVQRRRVELLTITNFNNLRDQQRIVFITARVHPGETPSSFVMHGFIDFLVSNDPRAEALRDTYVFKIVPMLNPDGVYLGNYRCSLMGFDLNRQWQDPSSWGTPTIFATKNLLVQYNNNPHIEIVMHIDLHAHSNRTNFFLYGNLPSSKDSKQCEQQLIIPYILAEITDDYSLLATQFNTDAEKAGTSRRAMGALLDVNTHCYTLEVSFFSYKPKDDVAAKSVPYLAENCKLGLTKSSIIVIPYLQMNYLARMWPFPSYSIARSSMATEWWT
uniref:Peptidase_M14 domain-containing protein n=1 Tax=Panagrellus redivivus TaxID=6233 RepID=A0A7E4VZK9_PANRE